MAAEVRAALPALRAKRAINVDGTTAEARGARRSRRVVPLGSIDAALEWLIAASNDTRRARLIEPDRSDVIVAGVVVVRETLRHLGVGETTASDRDLLDGPRWPQPGSRSRKKVLRRPAPTRAAAKLALAIFCC